MKVATLDVWTPRIRDIVRAALPDGFEIEFAQSYDPGEQTALVRDADFVLAGWAEVTGDMIRQAPRLRLIQKWGIGVDRIDLRTAEEEGVAVAIAAGSNASPVAEHAIMLMLAVYRRLAEVDAALRQGDWLFPKMRERCFQLRGKTVGLIGFGHIGRMVARKLAGFDVEIVYYDPVRAGPAVESDLRARLVDRDTLLERSDIVSLHYPGGEENRHSIEAASLARMKPGAVLINTARGELVDEAALCAALATGHLMGAGLDTFDPEPPTRDARILGFKQVVLTPHTAGSVVDNVEGVARHVFANMVRFLDGQDVAEADRVVTPAMPRRS
ncbi:2-hydroxyacid dehydrogenase [Zhengella sp. ZM62]|uniref:2-hydroxyacid dehydrogenase n=1 Tax=Zhengella sedimenti TaxID=3390035 RepID=UPI003976211F